MANAPPSYGDYRRFESDHHYQFINMMMSNIGFNYTYRLGSEPLTERFKLSFNKVSREIPANSWRTECINVAKHIGNQTNKKVMVASSGGIDSEIACLSLLEAGVPFSVVSVRHSAETNKHDIKFAEQFCRRNKIEHTILPLDMSWFLSQGIRKYIEQGYRSTNVFRYLQLFLLENITNLGGCAVLGGGEQLYNLNDKNEVCIYMEPSHLNTLEWCKNNSVVHYPYFFQTTPEVIASYISDELVSFLHTNKSYIASPGNSFLLKQIVCHKYFQDLPHRPKFSGFEEIINLRLKVQSELEKEFPDVYKIPFSVKDIKAQLGLIN